MKLEEMIKEITDQRILKLMDEMDELHPTYFPNSNFKIPTYRLLYELSIKNIAEEFLDKYFLTPKQ